MGEGVVEQKTKAYLSHRRKNGGLSGFAGFLLDHAPGDIDLRVDCLDAELSTPICGGRER